MMQRFPAPENIPFIRDSAQTAWGKIILCGLVFAMLSYVGIFPPEWNRIILCITLLASFFPRYRHLFIFIGALSLVIEGLAVRRGPDWQLFTVNYIYYSFKIDTSDFVHANVIRFLDIFLMIVVTETFVYLFKRYKNRGIFRYPVTVSYCFILSLLFLVNYLPIPKFYILIMWSFINVYNHYFWFTAYTMVENRVIKTRDYLLDYGRYLPIWGFTSLPYGKGSIYLSKVESHDPEALAITQIKALKLTCWAFALFFFSKLTVLSKSYFHIPDLDTSLSDYAKGIYYNPMLAWSCLIYRFFNLMLQLTISGHFIIGICRLCGFRALRNTYKPLASRTIAEFWNRYNFYFKELLAEFFYYPTYFRYFKNYRKLRIFFAAMAAATFGNILFHFLLITPVIMSNGLIKAFKLYQSFVLYTVILGISIGISQIRIITSGDFVSTSRFEAIGSMVLVLMFYCILSLFNQPVQPHGLGVDFKFLLSLFGIHI